MPARTFQELFCERFECPPAEYEKRALQTFLYPHARLLAPLVRIVSPELFTPDVRFIKRLGGATDLRDATNDLVDFNHLNASGSNFWRAGLKVRVSGRRAGRLARQLFIAAANGKQPKDS